jgi:hypothetical protein
MINSERSTFTIIKIRMDSFTERSKLVEIILRDTREDRINSSIAVSFMIGIDKLILDLIKPQI